MASTCADAVEHEEVHKLEDAWSDTGSDDADPPVQESTSSNVRPDSEDKDEEEDEDALEDEAVAEADGEDVIEASGTGREDWEPAEEEQGEEEEVEEGDEQEEEWAEPAAQAKLEEGDAEAELEEEEEEEEEWLEEEEEEEEEADSAEGNEDEGEEDEVEIEEHEEPTQRAKKPQDAFPPLPQQSETRTGQQWIGGSHRLAKDSATNASTQDQPREGASSTSKSDSRGSGKRVVSPDADARKGANTKSSPAVTANGRSSDHEGAASSSDHKSYKQLETENRQLRIELGQASYKVTKLSKLREQASESQRKELLARQNEARAIKELDLAKEYIGKKDAHFTNQKAELLQRIKYLEESGALIESRDKNLQEELSEATMYRSEAAQHVEEAKKLTEKWREEAVEQSKKVKQMELKLTQMEDKRQLDKQRLRELASLLQGQQAEENDPNRLVTQSGSQSSSLEKAPQKSGAAKRASSRGPSQNGKRKDDSADHSGKFVFDDPIKPIKSGTTLSPADESAGLQSRLAGLWQGLLRRQETYSLEFEGGCSGAPGRGKGKKGFRKGPDAEDMLLRSLTRGADGDNTQQHMVLGALMTVILGLAVAKIALA